MTRVLRVTFPASALIPYRGGTYRLGRRSLRLRQAMWAVAGAAGGLPELAAVQVSFRLPNGMCGCGVDRRRSACALAAGLAQAGVVVTDVTATLDCEPTFEPRRLVEAALTLNPTSTAGPVSLYADH